MSERGTELAERYDAACERADEQRDEQPPSRSYALACAGLRQAIERACETPDPRWERLGTVPYYGHPPDIARWFAIYVVREARRLRLWR